MPAQHKTYIYVTQNNLNGSLFTSDSSYDSSWFYSNATGSKTMFIGVDSMANVCSVNNLDYLIDIVDCKINISTSNGSFVCTKKGTFVFHIRDVTNELGVLYIKNTLFLPHSGECLIPLSMLVKLNFKMDMNENRMIDCFDHVYKLHYKDGLYYLPIVLMSKKEMLEQKSIIFPPNERSAPRANMSLMGVERRSPRWSCQILKGLFLNFDYARGPFYVDVLSNPNDYILKERIKGDAFSAKLHGDAFFINMVFDADFCERLLLYMEEQFVLDPHNTKYGVFIIHGKNQKYNYLLNSYELWDCIPANTIPICSVPLREHFTKAKTRLVEGFFGEGRAQLPAPEFDVAFYYRDIMTVPKINNIIKVHHILHDASFDKIKQLYEMGISEIGGVTLSKADFSAHNRNLLNNCPVCAIAKAYVKNYKKKLPKQKVITQEESSEIEHDQLTDFASNVKKTFPIQYKDRIVHSFDDFKLGELWFLDLTGPFVKSWDNKYYTLACMEAKSRLVRIYTIEGKEAAYIVVCLIDLYHYVDEQKSRLLHLSFVGHFHTDYGGEFVNKLVINFCQKVHISRSYNSAHTHMQNPLVERFFRSLRAMRKAILLVTGCPTKMWSSIDKRCGFVRNLLGYPHLDPITEKSPYYYWNQRLPSLKYFRDFWAPCYPITDVAVSKADFSNKTQLYRFLYIDEVQKGNRIYNERTNTDLVRGPLVVHDVTDATQHHLQDHGNITFNDVSSGGVYKDFTESPVDSSVDKFPHLEEIFELKSYLDLDDQVLHSVIKVSTRSNRKPVWVYTHSLLSYDEDYYKLVKDFILTRHMESTDDSPTNLVVNIMQDKLPVEAIITAFCSTDKTPYLVYKEDGSSLEVKGTKIKEFAKQSHYSTAFITIVTDWLKYVNPKTPAEARKRHDFKRWLEAENIEMQNIIDMKVIKEMQSDRPSGVFIHTSRFVYQLKLNSHDGTIDKYKVRLVFRGFTQKKGLDYTHSYAPA